MTLLALLILAIIIGFFLHAQADRASVIAGKAGTPEDVAANDGWLGPVEG